MTILALLIAWHFYDYYLYSPFGGLAVHVSLAALAMIITLVSLFYRGRTGELSGYVCELLDPLRPHMIGISCFLLGGLHFITLIGLESIFLQMGYMTIMLVFLETASIVDNFRPQYLVRAAPVTNGTLKRLLARQGSMLAMVYALSATMLYLSLMAVVGFVESWSVAVLSAIMILSLAFMTMVRRL